LAVTGLLLVNRGRPELGAHDRTGPERFAEEGDEAQSREELASAFAVTQRFVLQQLDVGRIRNVAWVEKHHEGHRGWYKFNGRIAVKDTDDNVYELRYEVVVSLDARGAWVLEDIRVSP